MAAKHSLSGRGSRNDLWIVPMMFSCAALFVQNIWVPTFERTVDVDFSKLNWLTRFEVGTERIDPNIERDFDSRLSSPRDVVVKKISLQKRKHFLVKGFSKTPVLGKVAPDDHIVLTAAAARTQPSQSHPGPADTMEKQKLLLVHRLISARLLIALNTPVLSTRPVELATQYAQPNLNPVLPTRSEVLSSHKGVSIHRKNKALKKALYRLPIKDDTAVAVSKKSDRKIASFGKVTYEPASVTMAEKEKQNITIEKRQEWNQLISDNFRRTAEELPKSNDIPEAAEIADLGAHVNRLYFGVLKNHLAGLIENIPDNELNHYPHLDLSHSVAQNNPQSENQDQIVKREVTSDSSHEYSHSGNSLALGYSFGTSQSMTIQDKVFIAKAPSHSKPLDTQVDTHQSLNYSQASPHVMEQEGVRSEQGTVSNLNYIEALDFRHSPIFGVEAEIITTEPTENGKGKKGWEIAPASNHWPTLYWADTEEGSNDIPLFHNNTIRSFEGLNVGGTAQQAAAGIVFGRVAPGWQVEIGSSDVLGQSEPIYFNSDSKMIPLDQTDEERTFVLLNVNPGSRVLYFRSKGGAISGGLALPVIPGISTFVDAKKIAADGVLSGTLYDENEHSGEQLWPLGGSTVRLIGQASAIGITDTNGYFKFNQVVRIGSYPLVLESYKVVEFQDGTTRHLGFTHRYTVSPKRMENLRLFRIARPQIKDWINQLPGGMSHESGLLVSAFTDIDGVSSDLKLLPVISSLPTSANLNPLAYTLNSQGYLDSISSTFIQPDKNRVLGVQLPEGPVVVKLVQDHPTGRVVWSQLVFAAPGRVNMMGPYSLPGIIKSN